MVSDQPSETTPFFAVTRQGGREFAHTLPEILPESIIGFIPSRERQDGELVGEVGFQMEAVEGWNELSARQIAGRAEQHNGARIRTKHVIFGHTVRVAHSSWRYENRAAGIPAAPDLSRSKTGGQITGRLYLLARRS